MKKSDELNDPSSCLNKAKLDEPVFVLRANDPMAPIVVGIWADMAAMHGVRLEKVAEAKEIGLQMAKWRENQLKVVQAVTAAEVETVNRQAIGFQWDANALQFELKFPGKKSVFWKISERDALFVKEETWKSISEQVQNILLDAMYKPVNDELFNYVIERVNNVFLYNLPFDSWKKLP